MEQADGYLLEPTLLTKEHASSGTQNLSTVMALSLTGKRVANLMKEVLLLLRKQDFT